MCWPHQSGTAVLVPDPDKLCLTLPCFTGSFTALTDFHISLLGLALNIFTLDVHPLAVHHTEVTYYSAFMQVRPRHSSSRFRDTSPSKQIREKVQCVIISELPTDIHTNVKILQG